MPRFSASLAYLWPELPLAGRVAAAARAGFAAVECHWPFDEDPARLATVLSRHRLPLLAVNSPPGDSAAGEFGLAAVPGREAEARAGIELALDFAHAAGAGAVHVMAGCAAEDDAAAHTFHDNLGHALALAAPRNIAVWIEPINRVDRPGYYLERLDQARAVAAAFPSGAVGVVFDAYHVHRSEGEVFEPLRRHLDVIAHVQVASVPDRGSPDHGELDCQRLFDELDRLGYAGYVGAEYRPRGATHHGLAWLRPFTTL